MSDIATLSIKDTEYPQALREIAHPPKRLYYRGDISVLASPHKVAVVGTRRCSDYGVEATRRIADGLARAGVVVVSGMARGVDTFAHRAALTCDTPTVAVLGSGVDDASLYPKQNLSLAHEILARGGLLLSEFEPGSPSYPSNFPQRNRIVAGLSLGTVVVEAPFKSGAMITARFAIEQNRDVYAVPGSVFSRLSEGTNFLIQQGAKCTASAQDILDDLNIAGPAQANPTVPRLNSDEQAVYALIADAPSALHVDKIIQRTTLGAGKVAEIIASLMLADLIREASQHQYIIVK
jgi:DNA processing protein